MDCGKVSVGIKCCTSHSEPWLLLCVLLFMGGYAKLRIALSQIRVEKSENVDADKKPEPESETEQDELFYELLAEMRLP